MYLIVFGEKTFTTRMEKYKHVCILLGQKEITEIVHSPCLYLNLIWSHPQYVCLPDHYCVQEDLEKGCLNPFSCEISSTIFLLPCLPDLKLC